MTLAMQKKMSDQEEEMSAAEEKHIRKKNFTDREIALLLDMAEPHVQLLTSKFTNTVTNKRHRTEGLTSLAFQQGGFCFAW